MSDIDDARLLIECDSLLSLIRHRERKGLSEQTIRDLDTLLPRLRRRTNEISDIAKGRAPGPAYAATPRCPHCGVIVPDPDVEAWLTEHRPVCTVKPT